MHNQTEHRACPECNSIHIEVIQELRACELPESIKQKGLRYDLQWSKNLQELACARCGFIWRAMVGTKIAK